MPVESLRILLKKIHHPQPTIGKKAWIRLPVGASNVKYDFLVGDCLPPQGKGFVADLEIEWVHPENPHTEARWQAFKCRMSGTGNGVSKPLPEPKPFQTISRLSSPHEAPLDGYEPEFDFKSFSLRGQTAVRVFKIRSDESGGPLFGKMRGPVSYSAGKNNDDFTFEYVINQSGDRGMEMDMERLSVPDRKEREEPPKQF